MSGSKWQAHVPNDLDRDLVTFKRENGIDDDAEAARQLWRKGVEQWKTQNETPPAIIKPLTEIGRVGLVAAAVGALMAVGLNSQELITATAACAFVALTAYSGIAGVYLRGDEYGW